MTGTADRQDEQTAITRSFLALQARLRQFVRRFSVGRQDVEDIVQETFLRAYESERRQKIDAPSAFLFTVAKNVALSEIQRRATRLLAHISDLDDLHLAAEHCVERDVDAQQTLAAVLKVVAALPPQCQRVVIMRKVLGLSHEEIGRQLGISVKTVERHLTKALKRCQDSLAEKQQAPGHERRDPGHTDRSQATAALDNAPEPVELLAMRGRQ